MRRLGYFVVGLSLAAVVLGTATGCQRILHELQPHRLWRLNRYSAPSSGEAQFSVSDPVAVPDTKDDAVNPSRERERAKRKPSGKRPLPDGRGSEGAVFQQAASTDAYPSTPMSVSAP